MSRFLVRSVLAASLGLAPWLLLTSGCEDESTPPTPPLAGDQLASEEDASATPAKEEVSRPQPAPEDSRSPGERALERYQKRIATLPEASATELDEEQAARIAKIGSIQTEADPSVLETIIGVKPDLDVTLTNQDHEEVRLNDLVGKTLVITSIFTSCPQPEMCPRLTSDIAWLSRQVPDELSDDIHFILVSLDPRVDTPEVMKAFGTARGLTYDNTDMLTGDPDVISSLLEDELQIPISYDPSSGRIATHATMVHVINPEGYLVVERVEKSRDEAELIAEEMVRAATMRFIPPEG